MRRATRSSTGCPGRTSRIDGGARLRHLFVSVGRRKRFQFSLPGINLGQDLGLRGIVVASQIAVLHAKSVAPKGEMSNCGLLSWAQARETYRNTHILSTQGEGEARKGLTWV
jgi:hypothetical protein